MDDRLLSAAVHCYQTPIGSAITTLGWIKLQDPSVEGAALIFISLQPPFFSSSVFCLFLAPLSPPGLLKQQGPSKSAFTFIYHISPCGTMYCMYQWSHHCWYSRLLFIIHLMHGRVQRRRLDHSHSSSLIVSVESSYHCDVQVQCSR